MNELQLLAALAGLPSTQLPNNPSDLKKALTTASGFLGINLEPQAKWLQPFFAGLRRRMPSEAPKIGAAQAQWRMQLGFGSFAFGAAASFGSANGAVGPATSESATTILADYISQSLNGGVQFEAIVQAEGWDNAMNLDTMNALSLLMRLEEYEVLFGNRAALTMSTPVMVASTLHAVPTFANGTWNIRVTAITGQGSLTNQSANSNVGETAVANASVASGASGCDFFDVIWPAVPGAVGYKVYIEQTAGGGTFRLIDPNQGLSYAKADGSGAFNTTAGDPIVTAGNNTQTYVTVTRVQIRALGNYTGNPAPPGGDASVNSNMFEGVLSWCEKSTIYGQALSGAAPIVTDLKGLGLTATSTGIKEFDTILQQQWVNNHTSPTLIICSSNSIVSMMNRIAGAGNNNQVRLDVYQSRNRIIGGLYIGGYVNKFASAMINAQKDIEVWAHPYMPDGTYAFLSEDVPPETLPYSRVSKVFALDTPIPYTYFELGRTDRSFPYAVFFNETLKCYWPSAQSAIVGARVDS